VPGHPYEKGFDLRLAPDKLTQPLHWRRPKKIFVNSMSDLFHEGLPIEYIVAVARVMTAAKWHTFQVLTKRSGRMCELLKTEIAFAATEPHIWWGVSVENRKHGLPRVDHLRNAPALNRFLSIEPLLEDLGIINLDGIDWVIVGGESGAGARSMDKEWVRSIRKQCRSAQIPFFFKQWGGIRKKERGRLLDGRFHDEFPARRVEDDYDPNPSLSLLAELRSKYLETLTT
jgi:protein gp37